MPTLSAADHEHFIEHGYVVLRAAVPHDTIEVAVEYLEAHPDDRGRQTDVVSACTTERMLDGIAELFGAPTYTLARRRGGNNMPRPYQPDEEWLEPVAHVDNSYPTTMPNGWAVGSFIFLTKVRPRGGAFVVFPGSNLRYRQQLAAICAKIWTPLMITDVDLPTPLGPHLWMVSILDDQQLLIGQVVVEDFVGSWPVDAGAILLDQQLVVDLRP
ncbi:MAG TPA: hypothetical protein QF604_07365 [Candidatus Latescibacteria bacterium]|jgi:hypothetical protein|nr:hypothetical protein [Gemmatimonadota bacterium]MDP7362479.1 hypothetical protein [Candidatus Latescibacterota bacterium]MDP7634123.1 hypothetical protein [Candidatus Latescibacterota bacterium]HJN27719.1 hypothetical protein [Candidatus Latescibacterota bacterium]|tara:strand:+ start:287 stop:928 length:642 start_codon:yes stop_codon:yes gene_type:complete